MVAGRRLLLVQTAVLAGAARVALRRHDLAATDRAPGTRHHEDGLPAAGLGALVRRRGGTGTSGGRGTAGDASSTGTALDPFADKSIEAWRSAGRGREPTRWRCYEVAGYPR